MQWYFVYVLRSHKDYHLYIGQTAHLHERLLQHQRGENISTARRLPIELIYFEGHQTRSAAERRERYFKTAKGKTMLKYLLRN